MHRVNKWANTTQIAFIRFCGFLSFSVLGSSQFTENIERKKMHEEHIDEHVE